MQIYTLKNAGLNLKMGETGIYSKSLKEFTRLERADTNILAYKTGIFSFNNTDLRSVINKVNEVYGITIRLENPALASCRLTVNFNRDTVDTIVEVIAETLKLTVTRNGNEILLAEQDVNNKMKLVPFILLTFCSWSALCQTKIPILERKVTIGLSNEKLPDALARIAQEGKFSFSYNSSIISNDQTVTLTASNKTIRDVLNDVFNGSMDYKEKSNHLILTKVVRPTQATTISVIISGYVEDAVTKEKIANASVYDKKSITSVVTDQFGYFRIKLEKKDQTSSIAVSKRDYRDTLVTITAPGNQYLNISIEPLGKDSVLVKATTSEPDSLKEELSLPYDNEPNIQNISDTLYRDIQISFLPFLGSNGALSGNVINNYSINMLGGYSLGTRQIELGFIVNIDRGDVSWLQIAGFGNLVGKNVYGVQASGFFNVNGGKKQPPHSSRDSGM
ncbi:MAG: FecR domain-containing protein [Bacteroidota bacterium]